MEYNPFKVARNIYKFCFLTKFKYAKNLTFFFESFECSISCFEADDTKNIEPEPDDTWIFEIYFAEYHDFNLLASELQIYCEARNMEVFGINFYEVPNIDWVKEVHENLPEYSIGDFLISSPEKEQTKKHKYHIKIAAARAFGTGGHETTAMCLKAATFLSKSRSFNNVLDIGTGSGILAIAAHLINKCKVLASDIDKEAVYIASENAKLNSSSSIKTVHSAGYQAKSIFVNKPYDLIFANILAKPLINMAFNAAQNLKKGGFLVLSGFLVRQSNRVQNIHELVGLKLFKKFVENEWVCLVMIK